MDTYVEDRSALFASTISHLTAVKDTPSTTLDADLLLRASRNTDSHTPRQTLWQVLTLGESTLQSLQQDARPLTRLLEQVVLALPFDELKETITPAKLESGLSSSVPAVQLLILAYLQKASDLPSGAAFVATSTSLTQCLIRVWLTDITEVADKCADVLVALLTVDHPRTSTFISAQGVSGAAKGQDLLWNRVFRDADVYVLLFEYTTLRDGSKHDLSTKKGQQAATIAQARLFAVLVSLAGIDWAPITTTVLPDVEQRFVTTAASIGGLLRYAASDMVDSSDVLMEVLRQDFFAKLVEVAEQSRDVAPKLLEALQDNAGRSESGMQL